MTPNFFLLLIASLCIVSALSTEILPKLAENNPLPGQAKSDSAVGKPITAAVSKDIDINALKKCVAFFGDSDKHGNKMWLEIFLKTQMEILPAEGKEAIQKNYYDFFNGHKESYPAFQKPSWKQPKKLLFYQKELALHNKNRDLYNEERVSAMEQRTCI
jgi:hypothetical protein